MLHKITILLLTVFAAHAGAFGQAKSDSIQTKILREIMIANKRPTMEPLPPIQGAWLWSGKKSEVISVQNQDVNLAERTPRQIFAKVPGVFVYDMDGTGNQVNISTRGLDPHRGWEFNIRANGVITNSDMYGYPASHFSIPMEAIERIELVRGTGALQYGAQFGGMLNYVLRKPDTTRTIGYETVNSIGSFGTLSTFHAISGKSGKWQYYAYYNCRVSSGYRQNSRTDFDAQGAVLTYTASDKVQLKASLLRSDYVYQIPGPLNDSMFHANPRTATRSRNYFSPEIYVPSLTVDWAIGPNTRLSWTVSAVMGARNSVQFDKPATTPDKIDPVTLQYAARQVDIDHFNSYTTELRFLHQYRLLGGTSALAAGAQFINNDLHRQQLGVGTTGSDYDLTLTKPGWGRDLHFKTQNVAFFVENKFQLSSRFSVSPGVRAESGASDMSGTISYYTPGEIPNTIRHRFPLLGINAAFTPAASQSLYAGWSQAYRPVIFKDIIPASIYEQTDKNLKDAYGYNLELGYRGTYGHFRWDVGGFLLQYNNRLGQQADESGTYTIYRTNIGNSLTKGVEAFVEYGLSLSRQLRLSLFSSTAYFDARYQQASVKSGGENKRIDGNKVEGVPDWISRNGLNVKIMKLSLSVLYSYTAASFADPLNTVVPSATGSVGKVPAYGLLDLNMSLPVTGFILIRLNVNNLTDVHYFTKRPTFYPGPGIWPSDGRSVNVSVAVRF